ncbi:MAG: hypothetical protein ACOYNY_30125 [Caldilineaceae bacterium]
MKHPLSLIFLLFSLFLPAAPMQAADDVIEKTYCTQGIAYDSIDDLKLDLLNNAKKAVINELFGEFIVASTAVENFVVTKDQIQTSSLGFVRVEGNTKFHNGEDFADVCVTIEGYVTAEDRAKFDPEPLDNKYCDADDDMTTAQLIAYVKDETIIQALIEYDPKLKDADKDSLLQLVQRVEYLESGFISDTQTYCATFEGEVVPVEVMAFLEAEPVTDSNIAPRQITLGTFDQTRVNGYSLNSGEHFEEARASLIEYFPQITMTSFPKLNSEALNGVDILYLASSSGMDSAIAPLSKTEQTSLFEFVQRGGCAILLPDNDGFDSNADAANESLVDVFGLDMSGTLGGTIVANITDPNESPIINGEYGRILSFTQSYPGGITNIGPYANTLASNNLGSALAMIPKDDIEQGSGPIIVFSDATFLTDKDVYGLFSENESLFLNTIDYCVNSVAESIKP